MSIRDIITNKQELRVNCLVYLLNVTKQWQQQQQHFGRTRVPPTLPPTYSFQVIPNQRVGNFNRKDNQLNPLTTLTLKGYYESFPWNQGAKPVLGVDLGV